MSGLLHCTARFLVAGAGLAVIVWLVALWWLRAGDIVGRD